MKFFALFICFYFSALTALPTVRLVKEHFAENCHSSIAENKAKESDSPSTCHKEKCFLNLTFNGSTFVVFNQSYAIQPVYTFVEIQEKTQYHKNLISHYNANIWQPPKILFLLS